MTKVGSFYSNFNGEKFINEKERLALIVMPVAFSEYFNFFNNDGRSRCSGIVYGGRSVDQVYFLACYPYLNNNKLFFLSQMKQNAVLLHLSSVVSKVLLDIDVMPSN